MDHDKLIKMSDEIIAAHHSARRGLVEPWKRVGIFSMRVGGLLWVASVGFMLTRHRLEGLVFNAWCVVCCGLSVWSNRRYRRRKAELEEFSMGVWQLCAHVIEKQEELTAGIEPATSALPRRRSST